MKLRFFAKLSIETYRRFLPVAFLITFLDILAGPAPLWAKWVVNVCPGGQQYACPCPQGPFATQQEAQSFADQENGKNGGCFTVSGSDDGSSSPVGGDSSSGLSPLNQSAYEAGEALGNLIRADDAAAKARADERERERVQKELYEVEQRRLKYEASKTEILNSLRDPGAGSEGGGLREVGSSGDNSGLREVGTGEGFMQAPPSKRPKVKHVVNYKYLATPTPHPAPAPTPKPRPEPTATEEVAGVQHADMLKDGVQLTGKPEGPLKDQIWAENTSGDPVDIHVWMAGESKNSAHSLRNNLHLEPGESVQVGWAANTTNEDPWNYQLGMNVTKK